MSRGRAVRLRPTSVSTLAALAPLVAVGLLAALVGIDAPAEVRVPVAVGVVLLAPGSALVGLLGLRRSAARAALVVGVSLATSMLLSEGLVLADRLTAGNALLALAAITAPASLVGAWRARSATVAAAPSVRRLRLDPTRRPELALTLAALVAWVVAVVQVDPRAAGDVGMVTALPLTWWAGTALLLAAIVLHARRGIWTPLAVGQVVALVALLFVTMTLAQPYSRIPTSYTHVGLVDYLVRDHGVVRHFDARFSWPGSLSLGATLTQLGGTGSSATFVRWAIPSFVGLWALAVYAAVSAYATSTRVRWVAVWLFLLLNWVGQDYWSPQATNFFLVLVAVAAVATWFPRRVLRARVRHLPFEQPPQAFARSGQGVGLVLLLVGIAAAVASSHQLSPFLLFGALTVLWLVDRRDIRLLPAIVLVLTLAWISWGAYDYWIGHFDTVTRDVGDVGGVVSRGTADRIEDGSAGRRVVLGVRLGVSIGMWVAAAAAFWFVARRRSSTALTVAALAAAPFGAVALQSYGGELGLRIFLFSLPFGALLVAEGLEHVWGRVGRLAVVVPTVAALVLAGAFVVARYGNEQFEQVYAEDVAAVRAVYDAAAPGSVVLAPNTANVFRVGPYKSFRPYKYDSLLDTDRIDIAEELRSYEVTEGYVLLTRAGIHDAELRQGAEPGWDRALRRTMASLGGRLVFSSGRAAVWSFDLEEASS